MKGVPTLTAMKCAPVFTLVTSALLLSCSAFRPNTSNSAPITSVKVWDADFKVVKVLGTEELDQFQRHWEQKSDAAVRLEVARNQHFKLAIARGDKSRSWIYQTNGYTTALSYQLKPVYKINDHETFNKLIGASK